MEKGTQPTFLEIIILGKAFEKRNDFRPILFGIAHRLRCGGPLRKRAVDRFRDRSPSPANFFVKA